MQVKYFQSEQQAIEYLEKYIHRLFDEEGIGNAADRYLTTVHSVHPTTYVNELCVRLTQGSKPVRVIKADENDYQLEIG